MHKTENSAQTKLANKVNLIWEGFLMSEKQNKQNKQQNAQQNKQNKQQNNAPESNQKKDNNEKY